MFPAIGDLDDGQALLLDLGAPLAQHALHRGAFRPASSESAQDVALLPLRQTQGFQLLEIDAPLDGVAHDLAQRVGIDGVYAEVWPAVRPYAGAGSGFPLRTTDGELPVQRLKAWLKEVDPS